MKLFNTRYTLFLLLALFLAMPLGAQVRPDKIRVVLDNNYPPFSFKDSSGKQVGILIDQWRLWERKTGIMVELNALDWNKALNGMKSGQFDVIDTIFKTEERTGWLDFTPPYARLDVPIFFDKEISALTDAASLKGFVVAVKEGDNAADILKRSGIDTLLLFNSYEEIVKAAKERKVTVFVIDKPPALYFLHKFGMLNGYKQTAPLYVGEFHRAVQRGHGDLRKLVEEGFARISPAELQKIETKWYGSTLPEDNLINHLSLAVSIVAIPLLVLFIWNRSLRRAMARRSTELNASEERFRAVFEQAADGILLGSSEGIITGANSRMEQITGRSKADLIGLHVSKLFSPDVLLQTPLKFDLLKQGLTVVNQRDLIRPDNTRITIEMHTRMLADGSYQSIYQDISERKAAEESLRLSRELFSTAFQSGPLLMTISDIETGCYQEVNENFLRISGFSREEVIGRSSVELGWLGAEDRDKLREELRTNGRVAGIELSLTRKNGDSLWCLYFGEVVSLSGEQKLLSIAEDISNRKKAEAALRESEEKFRAYIENSMNVIFTLDAAGTFGFVSPSWEKHFGYDANQVMGRSFVQFVHPDDVTPCGEYLAFILNSRQSGTSPPYRVRHADGVWRWFVANGAPYVHTDGELLYLGVAHDITEQKLSDEALRESEERLRVIFETSDAGIILVTPEGVIEFANRRMAEMFGMQLTDLLGTSYPEHLHESEKKVGDERMRMLIRGEIPSVANERRFIRKDGTDFWGYLSGRRLENPDGTLRALVGVISDITDRKNAEEERLNLERQLLHAQKLESLGILSGGIAHDFNNLLLAILGNLDLALMKLPREAPAGKSIEQAIKAGRHAAQLTNMMLAYSGKGMFVIKPLNLTELVEENAAMLDAAIPKSITLEQCLDHTIQPIKADAGQLQQVIMNLITNAAEAIGDQGGEIRLATGMQEFDQTTLNNSRLEEKQPAGRYVWLEVRDSGCGMDEETLRKLFDPFFTTKFTGRGLGMSAVLGIIRAHKGAFMVESVPGSGTTIKVLFPVAAEPFSGSDPVDEECPTPGEFTGSSFKVLVVDDEDMIRTVSMAMLEELGFKPLAAASGEEALSLFRCAGGDIDLVLLDQVMPGMDGVTVFRELRRMQPDIKVLLASGFSQQEVAERFKGLGLNGFIPKPYTMSNLSAELSKILKGSTYE